MKTEILKFVIAALIALTLMTAKTYDTQGYRGIRFGSDYLYGGIEFSRNPGLFLCTGGQESLIGNLFETGC